jgi:stearoyl-CoA desaturase (delta-9 desaturase)
VVAPALVWQAGPAPVSKYCRDIDTPAYRVWTRLQIPMVVVAFFAGLPFGLAAFFWIGPIRLTLALHAQCFVNSICHLRPGVPMGEPTARNLPWLGVMHAFQGEQWHQNHHDCPGRRGLGWTPPQLDVGRYTILLLEKVGLATNAWRRRRSSSRALDVAWPAV